MNTNNDDKKNTPNQKALQQRQLLKEDKISIALRANLKKRKEQAKARNNN